MNDDLEDRYFNWLYSQVASRSSNRSRTYYQLLEQMHLKTFTWFVPNDDNRVEDGKELRYEFMNGPFESSDECSFLEMLLALSRRLEFQSQQPALDWFWHLVDNLNLREGYSDDEFENRRPGSVTFVMDEVINRQYDASGRGGLFPLDDPHQDQRDVEIWYQMSLYLIEGHGP